jgi:hypothetical protein
MVKLSFRLRELIIRELRKQNLLGNKVSKTRRRRVSCSRWREGSVRHQF